MTFDVAKTPPRIPRVDAADPIHEHRLTVKWLTILLPPPCFSMRARRPDNSSAKRV
jgi:hypothetical protein